MDSQPQSPFDSHSNAVEIVREGDEWFVRVIEGSLEAISAGFEREEFAVSYAEGQCIRLGLPSFTRL